MRLQADEPAPRAARSQVPAQGGHDHPRAAHPQQPLERPAQVVELRRFSQVEHDAEDHLERDRPQARQQRERAVARPAGDAGLHDRGDRPGLAAHALAVEERQQQPALAQVLRAVQHQHRAVAEQRGQDRVLLAGARGLRVERQDPLDERRVADHDDRRPERQAEREHVAVPPRAPLQEPGRRAEPQGGLDQGREGRPGGQRRGC